MTVKPLVYTVIGAVILSLQGLHIHAAVLRDFRLSFSGSYLLGPWAAGFLGLVAYALLRGGLLVFGGQTAAVQPPGTSSYAFLALGLLTGFGWNGLLNKLNAIATQFFGIESAPPEDPKTV